MSNKDSNRLKIPELMRIALTDPKFPPINLWNLPDHIYCNRRYQRTQYVPSLRPSVIHVLRALHEARSR